jgi:hypothetical protein
VLLVSFDEGVIAWEVRCVIPILAMGITMEKEDFFRSVVIADVIGASLTSIKLNICAWRNVFFRYELKIGTYIFNSVADMKSRIGTSFRVESNFFTKFTGLSHFIMR